MGWRGGKGGSYSESTDLIGRLESTGSMPFWHFEDKRQCPLRIAGSGFRDCREVGFSSGQPYNVDYREPDV